MANSRRDWGRIRQLKSGKWQARYPGPDGLLRPAPKTFDKRADAALWLADKQSEIARSEWIDPDAGAVLFLDYAAEWIKERDLSETTRERYEGILRNHLAPTFGESNVNQVSAAKVRKWRAGLLEAKVGPPTVVKAYRLLRAIYTTAVEEDHMLKRNPCRIKGAGEDSTPERSVLSVQQVFAVADAIGPRYRVLVLLASFTTLRFGEFAALRRRDVNMADGEIRVRHSQAELTGRTLIKDPKSEAGKRMVAIPSVVLTEVREHLDRYAAPGADGLVFVGPQGGRLRRRNFRRLWVKAKAAAKIPEEVHFHDLRHTGNHLAATNGASLKELMTRMGHSTTRAALIYQHATHEREHAIADAISRTVRTARKPAGKRARKRANHRRKGHAGGTESGTAA